MRHGHRSGAPGWRWPVAILAAWGILVLLISPLFRETGRGFAAAVSPWSVSLLGVFFAGWALALQWKSVGTGQRALTAYGMVHIDRLGIYLGMLVLAVGFSTAAAVTNVFFIMDRSSKRCVNGTVLDGQQKPPLQWVFASVRPGLGRF